MWENITLKTGTYLPKHNDRYVTFRQRVKELHTNHLNLYREFIEKNYIYLGISKESMEELIRFISRFISKYQAWETGREAPECF